MMDLDVGSTLLFPRGKACFSLISFMTYEVVNEDTKSLWRKRRKILLSPKPLVKRKLNKLLVARIIVFVHA